MVQTENRPNRLVIKPQPGKPVRRLVKKKAALETNTNAGNASAQSHSASSTPKSNEPGSSLSESNKTASPTPKPYQTGTVRRRSVFQGKYNTLDRMSGGRTEHPSKAFKGKENTWIKRHDNLGEKIRVALSLGEGRTSPSNPLDGKRFKPDPAIVACGPLASPARRSPTKIPAPASAPNNSADLATPRNELGPFKDCVDTIVRWHAKDQKKFQKLLDSLKDVEASDSASTDEEAINTPFTSSTDSIPQSDSEGWIKRFNPQAKPFSTVRAMPPANTTYGPLHYPAQKSLFMPRVRPRLHLDINNATFHQRPVPNMYVAPPPPPPPTYIFRGPSGYPTPPVTPFPPVLALPLGPFEPIFDDDNELGRVARAQHAELGARLLESFRAKYPLTGMLKAAPQVPVEGRHAAAIQQRLEFLLLQKKEKEARQRMERGRQERSTSEGLDSSTSSYVAL